MLNFTVTITAAPELLAVMTGLINSINAGKMHNEVTTECQHQVLSQVQPQVQSQAQLQVSTQSKRQLPAQTQQKSSTQIQQQTPGQIQSETSTQTQLRIPAAAPKGSEAQANDKSHASYAQGLKIPSGAQGYTLDQLAVAATELVDSGRRQELVDLLSSFGVQALTMLPKEKYGAFAAKLKALGATL